MSNYKYLEFDSTYRNRIEWPLPSNFRIDISQSGVKGRLQALDPISNEAAKKVFTGSFRGDIASNTLPYVFVAPQEVGTPFDFDITTGLFGVIPQVRREDNFYAGSIITLNPSNTSTDIYRRIVSSKFIDPSRLRVTVDEAIPDSIFDFSVSTSGVITNPSFLEAGAPLNFDNPLLFIPSTPTINNFYKDCIVYNVNTGESRTIIEYNASIYSAVLDSPTPGWEPFHTYIIRKNTPCNRGVVGASTTNMVMLNASASDVDDFYVGSYLRIGLEPGSISPPYDSLPAPYNEVRRIVAYNGATRVATVQPPFSAAPFGPNNTYDIECFTRDNVVPFNYTGSLVSQQQAVCYEIKLINLTLPNTLLCSGKGGRIAFYPYVYVGLEAVSSGTTASNHPIYSNNPNSTRKLFRATIDDTPTPLLSPFIKVDGDGMIQTIKFKPNDSFLFTVCHADGTLFETVEDENFGPDTPNPLIQISALFSIRRITGI